jgi:polyhydroxybutyrate depolymerase
MKTLILLHLFLIYISACEPLTSTEPQTFEFESSISVNGVQRKFLVKLPKAYYAYKDMPLLVAIHGMGGSPKQFLDEYLIAEQASNHNYILVLPYGTVDPYWKISSWNSESCCVYAKDNKIDDELFIRELVAHMKVKYKVNPKRIFGTGMSNGAMMCYTLLCSNIFKGIAPVGGAASKTECNNFYGTSILHIHDKFDNVVPFKGKETPIRFESSKDILDLWVKKQSCTQFSEDVSKDYTFYNWTNCKNKSKISLLFTNNGSHSWPGGIPVQNGGQIATKSINANIEIFSFFDNLE